MGPAFEPVERIGVLESRPHFLFAHQDADFTGLPPFHELGLLEVDFELDVPNRNVAIPLRRAAQRLQFT